MYFTSKNTTFPPSSNALGTDEKQLEIFQNHPYVPTYSLIHLMKSPVSFNLIAYENVFIYYLGFYLSHQTSEVTTIVVYGCKMDY